MLQYIGAENMVKLATREIGKCLIEIGLDEFNSSRGMGGRAFKAGNAISPGCQDRPEVTFAATHIEKGSPISSTRERLKY